MKQILFFLSIIIFALNISFSQNRGVTRGAEPAELYLINHWYSLYYVHYGWGDSCRHSSVCRVTENGKKLTIQSSVDIINDYNPPTTIGSFDCILADLTPGVVYTRNYYGKSSYIYTSLWVSFDYGKNWTFREENIGQRYYYSANSNGLIYRSGNYELFRSNDYGCTFMKADDAGVGMESGLQYGEGWKAWSTNPYQGKILHSDNFFETYTEVPIDSQFMYGTMWISPDVYRGGLPGEVYISSMFYEESGKGIYKVSFSADTGHTFRHVYVSEILTPYSTFPVFMSDREPGVFYIIRSFTVQDTNPWGHHTKICIEYYRDYGETLVDTYCHDLHKNYGKSCEAVNDLVSEKINEQSILLTWSEPESSLPVEEYWVYRKGEWRKEKGV